MRSRPGTKVVTIKVTAEEWDALGRIAEREGLEWGGIPSRSEAVRWLISRDGPPGGDEPEPLSGDA
jgi:hypothetical protein